MCRALTASCLVVLLTSLLSAQSKPNFAGKWTVTDPNAASGAMGMTSMTVTQDDKVLTMVGVSQRGEFKTVFNLDGTPGKSPLEIQGMTIDRVTKLTWDGNKVVLTTVSDFGGQSFETKQVWSLNADGTMSVDSTRPDIQGGGGSITAKLTYKKQ